VSVRDRLTTLERQVAAADAIGGVKRLELTGDVAEAVLRFHADTGLDLDGIGDTDPMAVLHVRGEGDQG